MTTHPDGCPAFARRKTCALAIAASLAGLVDLGCGPLDFIPLRDAARLRANVPADLDAENAGVIGRFDETPDWGDSSAVDRESQREQAPHPALPRVSGRVVNAATGAGLSEVVIHGLPHHPATDGDGNYEAVVTPGWSGAATPQRPGFIFSPPSRTYAEIEDTQAGQDYVATAAAVLYVLPSAGLISSGPQGGPFDPVSRTYQLVSIGTQPLDWWASHRRPWVSLSQTSGTLARGENTTVTVSINGDAAALGIGTHWDTVEFTNLTTGAGNATRMVQLTATGPGWVSSWTNRGFDVEVTGTFGVHRWDAYTNDRYVSVPRGATPTITVTRNADLRRADHSPSPDDTTRVHIGLLTIGRQQFWTPDWDMYEPAGFVYEWPFPVGPVTEPTPVQIWNQHPGCYFESSDWLAYGSNAMEIWLLPHDLDPGNLPPVDYANGRLPAGQLVSAPPGVWPALYRDAADEMRLHAAAADLGATLYGDGGPYDDSSYGSYWPDVAEWAARNALIGWHRNSSAHLYVARQQLLAVLSVRTFTNECAFWSRARCVPNADFMTSYGRELSNMFFEAMVAACVLGPNMTDTLNVDELEAVNAHLYRFAVHDIFASLTSEQYYSANGGINLHYHPICVVAGWNWNIPEAVSIADYLPEPTHTECSYFIDEHGIGQYALRYCQLHSPEDKDYEHGGNSQSVCFWVRFSEFFKQSIDVYAAERYVIDQFSGLSIDCWDALDVLMDGWQAPAK
ncbi:MAG TPA: hypothetical protein PK920_05780 [Phycisphaerae bacterium]|jgi:hypothetical protein|nr:hypothetical protein [Phycisphaerae bacterium]HPC21978.1 hypothetical protein [Phycisphaerae bacterium]